jgi:hypothetical protein
VDYQRLVNAEIAALDATPVDILGIGDAQGEQRYLRGMSESYARTLKDVDDLFAGDRNARYWKSAHSSGLSASR